jgi:hypothetical protein
LAGYKKTDLRALAVVLSISDKGTNAELLSRIQSFFEESPDLKRNSQFSGLFNRERKGPTSNEDPKDVGGDPGPGDGGSVARSVDRDIARREVAHSTLLHPPHPPNTIVSSQVSSSSRVHYFHQYPMPPGPFGVPVSHPQPLAQPRTNHIAYNFNTSQPYTHYNNLP